MNNATDNTDLELIQAVYQGYVQVLCLFSSVALLLYTNILAIDKEIKYIWIKRFSLPNLLYITTRYGILILRGFEVWLVFSSAGNLCNIVAIIVDVIDILVYVGVQGLLITRAYSLSQGNKFIAVFLILPFLGGFIGQILDTALFAQCIPNNTRLNNDLILYANICASLTECVVFGVTLWAIWGTWKLKREAGMEGGMNNLVSTLFNQTLTTFCFACLISFVCGVIVFQIVDGSISGSLATLENALSTILVVNSLLELRRRNSITVESRYPTLPSIQFGNVLQYIHESIIVGMGDHDDVNSRMRSVRDEDIVTTVDQSGSGSGAVGVNT